jgi:hypothetical protein
LNNGIGGHHLIDHLNDHLLKVFLHFVRRKGYPHTKLVFQRG